MRMTILAAAAAWSLLPATDAAALTLGFSSTDVAIAAGDAGTPTGDVREFRVAVELTRAFRPGATVSNPSVATVDYRVRGTLDAGNPSQFPGFLLLAGAINPGGAPLSGGQFYGNGGSLDFVIRSGANLADGLQVADLAPVADPGYPAPADAAGAVFVLNAREVGTGRYHPPVLILRGDGSGRILNSNNTGDNPADVYGVEPIEGPLIGHDYGLEYVTDFTFDPAALTLIEGPITGTVPAPPAFGLLAGALVGGVAALRRRRRGAQIRPS